MKINKDEKLVMSAKKEEDEFDEILKKIKIKDWSACMKATDKKGHKENISFSVPTFVFSHLHSLADLEKISDIYRFYRKILLKGLYAELVELNEDLVMKKRIEGKKQIIEMLLKEDEIEDMIIWISKQTERAILHDNLITIEKLYILAQGQFEISKRFEFQNIVKNLEIQIEKMKQRRSKKEQVEEENKKLDSAIAELEFDDLVF